MLFRSEGEERAKSDDEGSTERAGGLGVQIFRSATPDLKFADIHGLGDQSKYLGM